MKIAIIDEKDVGDDNVNLTVEVDDETMKMLAAIGLRVVLESAAAAEFERVENSDTPKEEVGC